MYSDFEATAPTDNCFNPEQKKMFVMSYVLSVAFIRTWTLEKLLWKEVMGIH